MTVLGVGNALPDAMTTITLAKHGYSLMGISGSYSGQTFSLLIGFGLAQLKQTITKGTIIYDLFNSK